METDPHPPESGPMAALAHREVPNRSQSRASTTSAHSLPTQPGHDQSFASHGPFPDQWHAPDQASSRDMAASVPMPVNAQHMPANDIMLRPNTQMHHAQSFAMDASMSSVGPGASYSQHTMHHSLPGDSFATNASFTEPDSQMMEREEHEDADSAAGLPVGKQSSHSRANANNELEMRQLFQANRERSLGDVAVELHGNERGPNSERTRQIFAMLWISQVCTKGKGSVPRGRVYANYASRCATERITVLNPASFGKLVRVLFPGLRTRRLGVRGESKYHYVNFALAEDQPDLSEPTPQPAIPFPESTSFAQSFNSTRASLPPPVAEKRPLPSPEIVQQPVPRTAPRLSRGHGNSLYNQPDVTSIDRLHSTTSKTVLRLSFAEDTVDAFQQSEPLALPRIEPFLPSGTDPDAAKSLTALYRSHCTSLVECIRFCKEKTFFHLFTSFQGTLTMPVQKLFINPAIAPWIEECDFVLYQRMMRILSMLTLQVVPKQVLDTLKNIAERLVPHIRDSFQGQPRHVVQAKEAPAAIFAALLDRTLRVNLTAHAAANMLINSANRDQMYLDWITMVRLRKVAECVPTRGMDDVVNLLLHEMRTLLDPMNAPWEIEVLTLYGDMAQRSDRSPNEVSSDNGQNILDRWLAFLRSIPTRFPYASPSDIVSCVQRIGTEVMRDLTIAQGKSFGSWWVTKCWIDEQISYLAELGGFLQTRNASSPQGQPSDHEMTSTDKIQNGTRLNHGLEDLNGPSHASQPQPDRAPFPPPVEGNAHGDSLHLNGNPDDSGIGIRTPEEDFPMEKFQFQQGDGQELGGLDLDTQLP